MFIFQFFAGDSATPLSTIPLGEEVTTLEEAERIANIFAFTLGDIKIHILEKVGEKNGQ